MVVEAPTSWHRWLLMGGACLLVFWSLCLTTAPADKDAGQNVRLAVNLAHHGVISEDRAPPYRRSMTREPLPVVETAALIRVGDWLFGGAQDDAYFSGHRVYFLKYQNVLWMLALIVGLFTAIRQLTSSHWAAIGGVALFHVALFQRDNARYMLDSLYTETPAAALLLIGSLLLMNAMLRGRWLTVIAAGVAFGLLALVKAVFLYVCLGVIAATACAVLLGWTPESKSTGLRKVMVIGLCLLAVVAPWMLRNYHANGQFAITERGGEVLYTRALKDRMSPVEVRGAVSYWAPWPFNAILRRALGFTARDLQTGGRLQRLNRSAASDFAESDNAASQAGRPELAVSYYRQATAERSRLRLEFQRQGRADFEAAAGRSLQRKAMQMIKERPVRHLVMTPLFLWRGAFYELPMLLLALAITVKHRNLQLGLLLLPAFGTVMFYGLFSHFIPRYSLPVTPVAVLAAVVVCMRIARWRGIVGEPRQPQRIGH